ncbi:MAG TPA: BON domain-containing protein [Chitinophagales bacterium]|nr:BON domain-containing protein [Chitinophagales bacterium]
MKILFPKKLVSVVSIAFLLFTINGCGVKDSTIKAAIAEQSKTMTDMSALNFDVQKGVVTITGECKDEATRAMVENSVKSIKGVTSVTNNTTVTPPPPAPAPVVITADDPLTVAVTDAIKDYPGVMASVQDGVITLTGEIKKADLTKLMMSLNSLKPKKIANQLTIK